MNCIQPCFQEHQYEHSFMFTPTLINIVRNKWSDIDHHRNNMASTFYKIKNIKWIKVDSDKYDDFIGINRTDNSLGMPVLTSSRYCHIGKCHPNYHECIKCFKYNCIHCGEGTNSMYGGRCSKRSRCSKMIDCYPELLTNVIKPRRIYIFKNEDFLFMYK